MASSRPEPPELLQFELQITSNLAAVLRQLQDNGADNGVVPLGRLRVFWADAISINQRDERERGHHVRLMSRMYKQCLRVCIWLEEASDDSDELMNLAMEFSSKLNKISGPGPLPGSAFRDLALEAFTSVENILGKAAVERIMSLVSFFWRPWFRRLWVLQEMLLAPSSIALCGSKSVAWDPLWRFLYFGFEPISLPSRSIVESLLESSDEDDDIIFLILRALLLL